MVRLDKMIKSDAEPNRKAESKIRYAIGLRNSFGKCWYLTSYGYDMVEWRTTSSDRKEFKDNSYAQRAYKKVDSLMDEAMSEFTDPERAAQAQLEMMNYATLMKQYPNTKAAAHIRLHCDNLCDYSLQHR